MPYNCIVGEIQWEKGIHPPVHDQQGFDNGSISLTVQRIRTFDYDEQSVWYTPVTHVMCAMLGYIANIDDLKQQYGITQCQDVAVVEQLYTLKSVEGVMECDGSFVIVIFDEKMRTGYIFQSEYGMYLPIYYHSSSDGVLFSTSLKPLLRRMSASRELNGEAVKTFLLYEHIIPNATTLIKGVYKVVPHKYLRIDCQKRVIAVEPLVTSSVRMSKAVARQELLPSIEANIRRLQRHVCGKMATTLTAGWDTNLILFTLSQAAQEEIAAVTIDGGKVQNEIPATRQILQAYQQVTHLTSTIQPSIVEALPNMVWMLEGAVFENGMFLRYELGKVFAQHGIHTVFLGACADQVLYPQTMFKRLAHYVPQSAWKEQVIHLAQRVKDWGIKQERLEERELRRQITQITASVYSKDVTYHLDIEFLLKMHGLIFNGFGVQGLFPFLNRTTAHCAQALGMSNRQKRVYKAKIRERLPSAITQYFKKSGAVVDAPGLVAAHQTMFLRILQTPFVQTIIQDAFGHIITQAPAAYYKLLLQAAYLYLFNELFVSGIFDDHFDHPQIDVSFSQILELTRR